MFRWSEETTFKFVSKYLEHECLWNVRSPLYKMKHIKQAAYIDIEKEMDVPGFGEKDIKWKIKNIRSTYSQELKKIRDSKSSGSDIIYIPNVKWFSLLDASLRTLTEYNCAFNSSQTYDTEQNSAFMDTFRESTPSPPPTQKRKLTELSSMVGQLKEIVETANSSVDENEFEVFGKHIGLQLKSLPLLLALEAQEHIHLFINKIRRQHIENESANNVQN